MTHDEHMEAYNRAKEGAKDLVLIKGETINRKYIVKVYGGICDGVQAIDFEDRYEAEDYALDELRPFYKRMGRRVRVYLAA